jgi:uncharacterized RDD family membrane protein YckC
MSKTIDITTTQNVTIEYDLAPMRERALAWVIDLVLVMVGYFIFLQILRTLLGDGLFDNMGWMMLVFLFPFVLFFGYNILFEILRAGQTPGKSAMSIKVVRLDGKDPEWADVLLRAVLHLVDSLFSFAVIGSLLIKTTPKSQRLGDMAANTTVIKIQGLRSQFRLDDILNISTLSNYQPVYPQVKSLGEKDMIFIKTVLMRFQRYPNQAHHEVVEDLVSHLMPLLGIEQRPKDRIEFLRTLLRDYIVLTR